jgi:hypothetical protein
MGTTVFSDDETRYLKAVMKWQDTISAEEEKRARLVAAAERAARKAKQQAVGEFRILVIGARGTGKTSILTRVRPPLPPCPLP